MDITLLVLAAGMGSRYGGIKQLDRLGPSGETIMDYSIFDAKRAGFNKVVFVIRQDFADDFKEIFIDKLKGKIEVAVAFQDINKIPEGFEYHPERKKPWGTAHAMLMASELIMEPFAAINADDFYGKEAYETMAEFLKRESPAGSTNYAMCGYKLENTLSEHGTVSRGICQVSADGYLQSVHEHVKIERVSNNKIISHLDVGEQELSPNDLVSMNFWGFNPTVFDIIEDDFKVFLKNHSMDPKSEIYTPKVVDDIIKRGQGNVKMLQSDAKWFGVTYQEDKQKAVENLKALVNSGEYPVSLWS
jgi:NDP-sugar pyrophosphorylase family protein